MINANINWNALQRYAAHAEKTVLTEQEQHNVQCYESLWNRKLSLHLEWYIAKNVPSSSKELHAKLNALITRERLKEVFGYFKEVWGGELDLGGVLPVFSALRREELNQPKVIENRIKELCQHLLEQELPNWKLPEHEKNQLVALLKSPEWVSNLVKERIEEKLLHQHEEGNFKTVMGIHQQYPKALRALEDKPEILDSVVTQLAGRTKPEEKSQVQEWIQSTPELQGMHPHELGALLVLQQLDRVEQAKTKEQAIAGIEAIGMLQYALNVEIRPSLKRQLKLEENTPSRLLKQRQREQLPTLRMLFNESVQLIDQFAGTKMVQQQWVPSGADWYNCIMQGLRDGAKHVYKHSDVGVDAMVAAKAVQQQQREERKFKP